MNKLYYLLFLVGLMTFAGCTNVGVTEVDKNTTFKMNCTNCGGGTGNIVIITGDVTANTTGDMYLYNPTNLTLRFNNTKIDARIDALTSHYIDGVTAGAGLIGGGTSGNISLRVDYSAIVNKTFLISRGFMTSFTTGKGLFPSKIVNGSNLLLNYSIVANKTYVTGLGYLTAEVDGSVSNEIQNIIASKGLQRDGSNNFGIMNCALNQILKYNSSNGWMCVADSVGTITSITAGIGLTGGSITTTGTIALNTTYVQNVLDAHDIGFLATMYDSRFTGKQQNVIGSVTGYGNTEKGYWRSFSDYNGVLSEGTTTGTITYTAADVNVWGVLNCATGTTKLNDCAVSVSGTITTNGGNFNSTKILKFETIHKAVENTLRREALGVFRTTTSANINKSSLLFGVGATGYGFFSSTNVSDYATTSWKAFSCLAGSCTVQNTTVALDTNFHKFTIIPNLDGATTKWIAYYIDGVLKNNITSNLPRANVNIIGAWVETDAAAAKNFKLDMLLVEATR